MQDIPITYVIIGVTILISINAWNNPARLYRWMLNPYAVMHKKQFERLITSGFIHADTQHLAFNMLTLFFFGRLAEQVIGQIVPGNGQIAFLLFYLLAMVAADLPSLYKYHRYPNYNSLGASGAVSAVLFTFVLIYPWENIYLFMILPIPSILFAVLYIYFSYRLGKRSNDNINHDAHLFGALFGLFVPIIIRPQLATVFLNELLKGPQWAF